jgi:hypothetical protein
MLSNVITDPHPHLTAFNFNNITIDKTSSNTSSQLACVITSVNYTVKYNLLLSSVE